MQKNSCCGTFQILSLNIFKENTKIRETRSLKEQLEKTKSSKFLSWKVRNEIGKNKVGTGKRTLARVNFGTRTSAPISQIFINFGTN